MGLDGSCHHDQNDVRCPSPPRRNLSASVVSLRPRQAYGWCGGSRLRRAKDKIRSEDGQKPAPRSSRRRKSAGVFHRKRFTVRFVPESDDQNGRRWGLGGSDARQFLLLLICQSWSPSSLCELATSGACVAGPPDCGGSFHGSGRRRLLLRGKKHLAS